VIAFMNQKGGVGKTTTTVNLGAALAEAGKRVCLIDLDPQGHLTINYGVELEQDAVSLYDVLVEGRSILEAMHVLDSNIAVVPSSIDLAAAEVELVSVIGREMLLRKKLESAQHDFDYVLLDCPPSLGLLTINALAVATEVIIPMQAHFLALQGVGKLLETVALVSRRMNPKLKVSGIVLTMFDSQTKLSNEVVADLESFIDEARGKNLPWSEGRVFNTRIRRNIKLAESPGFGKSVLKYEPMSNGAADYRALAREVMSLQAEQTPDGVTVSVEGVDPGTLAAARVETKAEPAEVGA
jgi:chromosome partitioning protein